MALFGAAVGGLIGWYLAGTMQEDKFVMAVVVSGIVAGVGGAWVGAILSRLRL